MNPVCSLLNLLAAMVEVVKTENRGIWILKQNCKIGNKNFSGTLNYILFSSLIQYLKWYKCITIDLWDQYRGYWRKRAC